MNYFIGMMSGTSLDGIDSVILSFEKEKPTIIETDTIDFPKSLRIALTKLISDGFGHLETIGTLNTELSLFYAKATNQILKKAKLSKEKISAIGCHGQTIFHKPDQPNAFSWQLVNLAIIAKETQIPTIGDFRSLDIAYDGQGAPLAPAFHQAVFSSPSEARVIVNLGGIANISCLSPKRTDIIGFDTGPANALLDAFYQKNHPQSTLNYDDKGQWASTGTIINSLLDQLLKDPYFSQETPKSTGKEYFNLNWLDTYLNQLKLDMIDQKDIQATLSELSAITISDAIKKTQPETNAIYLAGGGCYNLDLIFRLKKYLKPIPVETTDSLGISPKSVEASLIAWLAKRRFFHETSNLPSVTGASQQLSLGVIYLPS